MNSRRYASAVLFTLIGVGVATIIASCVTIDQNQECRSNCDAEVNLDKALDVSVPARPPAPAATTPPADDAPRRDPPATPPGG